MSARDRAAGILGPGKLRQLEEAGLVVVDATPVDWQTEEAPHDADTFWETMSPELSARIIAVEYRGDPLMPTTGRIRPLYAGDPQEVEG